jgi:DNA-binding transcriptional regulator YiaG
VFILINRACRAMREAKVSPDDIEIYRNASMKSSDYATVLQLTKQTVTVEAVK